MCAREHWNKFRFSIDSVSVYRPAVAVPHCPDTNVLNVNALVSAICLECIQCSLVPRPQCPAFVACKREKQGVEAWE